MLRPEPTRPATSPEYPIFVRLALSNITTQTLYAQIVVFRFFSHLLTSMHRPDNRRSQVKCIMNNERAMRLPLTLRMTRTAKRPGHQVRMRVSIWVDVEDTGQHSLSRSLTCKTDITQTVVTQKINLNIQSSEKQSNNLHTQIVALITPIARTARKIPK